MLPSIAPRAVAPLLLRSSLASSIPLTWSPSTVAARRHSSTLLATRSQRPAQISAGWMGARPAMASAAQPSAVIIFRRLATTGSDGQQQQQQQKTEDGGAGAGSAGAGAGAGASAGAGAGAGKQGFFSSDSWTKTVGTIGALANWAIPLAAITHMLSSKDPATTIDPMMTSSLAVYSLLFMRWAIAVTPANYPLLVCHVSNEAVQLVQLGRWANATYNPASKDTQGAATTTAVAKK